ncbi:MFS transporter [Eggerthellaceae bacterium zg-1084]|uniref:MFS transporter n=1 Tax=Berryella wangjianweii TaxID=2734634 RepID=UPI0015532756|nr:MFS transporter [Berryella wangjianweii]NPD30362.1 MFS transporter [Berryella wangjianweii]
MDARGTSRSACRHGRADDGPRGGIKADGGRVSSSNASAAAPSEEPLGAAPVTIDEAPSTPFLRRIAFFSSGGSFLDGYVLSLIGVALTQIGPLFRLTDAESAAIGASVLAGILLGTVVGGYLTDLIGRKRMFVVDIVALGVLSLLSTQCADALQLICARFLIGVFVGADYPIATSLIAEFAPTRSRAVSMGMVSAAWYLGATVAAVVGWALIDVPGGWRWMLGSAIVPCAVLLIGRRDIPESPRWLASKGRHDEAAQVMSRVFGPHAAPVAEPARPRTSLGTVFSQGYLGRILFLGVLTLCQVVPMYAIYTFGPDIMAAFGLASGKEAILGESAVSLLFLLGTFPAMYWLNTLGRRRVLIGSLACMLAGLVALGLFPQAPAAVIVAAFGLYAFFSGGPGILQWLYPNELFPTEVRATAVGVAIGISRVGTIAATYGLPLFLARFGIGPTMLVAAGLVALALGLSAALAPETRGKTLSEASAPGRHRRA